MTATILKACGVWLLFIPLAIVNGLAREKVLAPLLGQQVALPVSGLTLSALIFGMTFLLIPFIGALGPSRLWAVGVLWVGMTIAFEFSFGHYVMGKEWSRLLEAYRVSGGNLWVVVLIVTAVSPYLAAKLRGAEP
jgi:hypothetical protein